MPVEIDIEHVAKLARLDLTEEERERLRAQLGMILEHAAKVGEVAAEDVPPTASPIPHENVFREDVPEPSLPVARYSSVRWSRNTGWLTPEEWRVICSGVPPPGLTRQMSIASGTAPCTK